MILLGSTPYAAGGDGARRQAEAMASAGALRGVSRVNLQWADDPFEVAGWQTLPVLREGSLAAAGRAGNRKPVVREVFDVLAREALRRGCVWFAFTNSDIRLTQRLVDFVGAYSGDGVAVSRTELDGASPAEVTLAGIDTFLVRATWWERHRHRFRRYLIGEPVWDNVYTALLMRHGDSVLLNTPGWAFHERHPAAWRTSPFAEYTRWLAALDRPDFTRWAEYHARLVQLRATGDSPEAEHALARQVFGAPERGASVQLARVARAGLRYLLRG